MTDSVEDQSNEAAELIEDPPEAKEDASVTMTVAESEPTDPLQESIRDISYHPGEIVFYSRPQQRQKWGDCQILPRVNWGDTFYDLFFVAAAYNVGNILLDSPSGRGLLYFLGCFFPVMTMWREKMYYDARFVMGDDLWHRILETIFFVIVSGGILHISTVDVMSNPREYVDMFAFSLVLVIFSVSAFVGYGEVLFMAEGQRDVIKGVVMRDLKMRVVPLGLQLAAATVAGVEYFVHGEGASSEETISSIYNSSGYSNSTFDEGDGHRLLAGEDSYSSKEAHVNDIPIWLCIGSFLSYALYLIASIQFLFPKDGSHKEFTIPLNIAFMIHRDGEWIMLMLGETILSLLIVDVTEKEGYYLTFFCGILTAVLLQYLHYRSQPHDANLHASRRDKDAGIWWSYTNCVYSAALICVGVSYKHFLYDFTYEARRLEELEAFDERVLAGGSGLASVPTEVRQQAAANLFSSAMTIAFLCLDAMILLHRGIKVSVDRCQCSKTKRKNKKGILLTVVRVGLIIFFATLSQYENDPEHLALLGLAGVVAQLIIRQLGLVIFVEHQQESEAGGPSPSKEQLAAEEDELWPNVTHAAVEKTNKRDEVEPSEEGNRDENAPSEEEKLDENEHSEEGNREEIEATENSICE